MENNIIELNHQFVSIYDKLKYNSIKISLNTNSILN